MNAPANSMDESKPGDLLLVTGASGFVGSAISNAARAQGYRVRVLVRPSSPRTNIAPGDEVVVGDIRDRASLVAALRGVRPRPCRRRLSAVVTRSGRDHP